MSNPQNAGIMIEVSPGELCDKITILEVKKERIQDKSKQSIIDAQLTGLKNTFDRHIRGIKEIEALLAELKEINSSLWDIENEIRICERESNFSYRFIELARSIYRKNDLRTSIKNQINEILASRIIDIKDYELY